MGTEIRTDTNNSKLDIKSMTLQELKTEMAALEEKPFRAGQIYRWLHQKNHGIRSFSQMTDISGALAEKLDQRYYINALSIQRKLVSKIDGTVKYLFGLTDGNCVEAVVMRYKYGNSLCISTQVGCKMGCKFCASTLAGWVRNLTPSEMLDEIYAAQEDTGEKIASLVLMGIGEPLDNYDNVIRFLTILSSPEGQNLSLRHVSLSTCGLVDRIYDLMKLKLGLTLSISLHAPNDEIRRQTMPVSLRYDIDTLLKACRDYFAYTGRRISFEYALIAGVNDSPECARELANRLKGMPCHVNLIPVNPVKERGYRRGSKQNILHFQQMLQHLGINATVRRELGSDINAACGQLRRETEQANCAAAFPTSNQPSKPEGRVHLCSEQ